MKRFRRPIPLLLTHDMRGDEIRTGSKVRVMDKDFAGFVGEVDAILQVSLDEVFVHVKFLGVREPLEFNRSEVWKTKAVQV